SAGLQTRQPWLAVRPQHGKEADTRGCIARPEPRAPCDARVAWMHRAAGATRSLRCEDVISARGTELSSMRRTRSDPQAAPPERGSPDPPALARGAPAARRGGGYADASRGWSHALPAMQGS